MPLPTCAVTCKFTDAAGDPLPNAKVVATLSQVEVYQGVVVPTRLVATTDEDGQCVLNLFPNALGQASSRYTIGINGSGPGGRHVVYAVVPAEEEAQLEDLLVDRDYDTPPIQLPGGSVPVVGTFAEIDDRDDLKAIDGSMAYVTDRGTWGSRWMVLGGEWRPDGAIQGLGTPEGVLTAPVGSEYVQIDAANTSRLTWFKASGSGNSGWTTEIINFQQTYSTFNPENYTGTEWQKLAAATVDAEAVNGKVVLQGRDYWLGESWIVVNNVDAIGVHPTRTVFKPLPGFCGPVIVSWPKYEEPKHAFRNIGIQGGREGVTVTAGTVTKDSNTVTGIPSGDMVGWHIGDKLEGLGLDDDTFITAVGSGSVTVNNVGKFYRSGITVATDTKLIRREGYVFTGTVATTVGNAVVTITAGAANLQYVKKWMFGSGNKLESDGEDLSSNNRVMSVDLLAGTVTLDRPAKDTGSFQLRLWLEVEALLAPETEFYAPEIEGNKICRAPTLDNVVAEGMGGTAFKIRPKRDQFHAINGTRAANNSGRGYDITASNDSQVDAKSGGGANWKSAVKWSSSATGRWLGGECWDTQLIHLYADAVIRGCRQFTAVAGDVNGRWDIKGKGGDEPNHGIRLIGWNWKWHSGKTWPDGTSDAYLKVDGAHVALIDPYWYGDREDDNAPDYLIKGSNGAVITLHGSRVIDDPLIAQRPWKVGRFDLDATSKVVGWLVNADGEVVEMLGDVSFAGQPLLRDTAVHTDSSVSNGGNRVITALQAIEVIDIGGGTIASYEARLPYIHRGSKYLDLQIVNGNITTFIVKTTRADDTTLDVVDVVPSVDARFDDDTAKDLPRSIAGNTTVRLFWNGNAAVKKWRVMAVAKASDPYVQIPYAATIALDLDLGTKFLIGGTTGITGNLQLNNPSHMYDSAVFEAMFKDNGTAGWLVTLGAKWRTPGGFTSPPITTLASAVYKLIGEYCKTLDIIDTEVRKDIKA